MGKVANSCQPALSCATWVRNISTNHSSHTHTTGTISGSGQNIELNSTRCVFERLKFGQVFGVILNELCARKTTERKVKTNQLWWTMANQPTSASGKSFQSWENFAENGLLCCSTRTKSWLVWAPNLLGCLGRHQYKMNDPHVCMLEMGSNQFAPGIHKHEYNFHIDQLWIVR